MLVGVVGKLRFEYTANGHEFTEIVDIIGNRDFRLTGIDDVLISIDEVTYIEDTIYAVEMSVLEPPNNEYIFVSGSLATEFIIKPYDIRGTVSLDFIS